MPMTKQCPTCQGEGVSECEECYGEGLLECRCDCGDDHEKDCAYCDGEGRFDPCPECEGACVVPVSERDLEAAGQLLAFDVEGL